MSPDKLLGSGVVAILKVGLPGIVFLLAYMSYRLLIRADIESKSATSTQNAQRFMIFAFLLTLLTVLSSTFDVFASRQKRIAKHDIGRCRDAIARIETAARDPEISLEELRATVNNQAPACALLLQEEDK